MTEPQTYIVLDLEWNQSIEGKNHRVDAVPFEIIEIGAVKLDADLQPVSTFQALICPKIYPQLHPIIMGVTHLTEERLRTEGRDFVTVMRDFLAWCGTDYRFCLWGSMDLTELQRNMNYYAMEETLPFPLYYLDIQKLYAMNKGNRKEVVSLEKAVDALSIETDGPFHRALDDARYTGKVMQALPFARLKAYFSMDYYRPPATREEEIRLSFPTYEKYVTRTFRTKEEIMEDPVVTELPCQCCGKPLRKKFRWFSFNQRLYYTIGECQEHGYTRGKIRMHKTDNGAHFAVRTVKCVDMEGADAIFRKREALRIRNHERK